MTLKGDSRIQEARVALYSTAFLVFFTWSLSSLLKEIAPLHAVHLSLFSLFILSSLLIVFFPIKRLANTQVIKAIQIRNNSPHAPSIVVPYVRKPLSGFGWRVTSSYVLLTAILFLLVNSSDWQSKFVKTTKFFQLASEHFYVMLLAPLYEEIFFRGAFLYTLQQCFSILFKNERASFWSVYVSALVFWVFHIPLNGQVWSEALAQGGIPASPGPFLLGIVCGIITIKDKSILFAVLFHVLANSLGIFWEQIIRNEHLLQMFYSRA